MTIPDFQSIMLPFLISVADRSEHKHSETIQKLAKFFGLSDEELRELLPSGRQAVFTNRVGWARTYLMKAGLIEYTRRGYCRITARGLTVINENPKGINISYLKRFPEFSNFHNTGSKEDQSPTSKENVTENENRTPEENLEYSYLKLREELAHELLTRLKNGTPQFFERVVVELLVKMGYGGSIADAGKAIGRSGDGGIDGMIKEDRLGLDIIYIQAKRWEGSVGRPEIQKFVGALQGNRARKGVFITTSSYTKEAREYVTHIDSKVALIDGEQMAQYMIDHNLGVTTIAIYEEKRIDSDFFMDE
ncbi:restriction endonuclease [Paenibacillus lactis]|uniref:Restriction endonuclease n=1 Tax=Paenibacillus lactis 154 TaxID=743719 RepID=G4HNF9_9BACL|nr:restriction endonuclease [Paenibacillus lactis]EHB50690.1 restriction endonuclease [Paenibacillus lactis 154]